MLFGPVLAVAGQVVSAERPNIVWLTSEDNGPHLGCYGDAYATTPHLDALARRGTIYTRCWSNAPVCAPARTAIITGVHPPSLGAEHMRSEVRLPAGWMLFPQYLRAAGYYCTNNSKEDYRRGAVSEQLASLPRESPQVPSRMRSYVGNLLDHIRTQQPNRVQPEH